MSFKSSIWFSIVLSVLIAKFDKNTAIIVKSKCGLPGEVNEAEVKSPTPNYQYFEGDVVQYECANDAIYRKAMTKTCRAGRWLGEEPTCGYYVVNQAVRVAVFDLTANASLLDVATELIATDSYGASYYEEKKANKTVAITETGHEYRFDVFFSSRVPFDMFLVNFAPIKMGLTQGKFPISSLFVEKVRVSLAAENEDGDQVRDCQLDNHYTGSKWRVFWFICKRGGQMMEEEDEEEDGEDESDDVTPKSQQNAQGSDPDLWHDLTESINSTGSGRESGTSGKNKPRVSSHPGYPLRVSFITKTIAQMDPYGLNQIYMKRFHYCGWPSTTPLSTYEFDDNKQVARVVCDDKLAIEPVESSTWRPKAASASQCLHRRDWAGQPSCRPRRWCHLPNVTDDSRLAITAAEKVYVFNDSEWFAIEGSVIQFQCRPGHILVGAASATCQSDFNWSQKAPVCISGAGTIAGKSGSDLGDMLSASNPVVIVTAFVSILLLLVAVGLCVGIVYRLRHVKSREMESGDRSDEKARDRRSHAKDELYDDVIDKTESGFLDGEAYDEVRYESVTPEQARYEMVARNSRYDAIDPKADNYNISFNYADAGDDGGEVYTAPSESGYERPTPAPRKHYLELVKENFYEDMAKSTKT